jgi:hypothetical protein
MSVALRYQSTQPNKVVTFDFGSHEVLKYLVGVAYWSFSYKSSDNHVETLALNLLSNKPNNHQISTKVDAILSDTSGNNIDNETSRVVVCCVALVDSPDSSLTLAGADHIDDNSSSGDIALPGSSLSVSTAGLSGFRLSYDNVDHHVHEIDLTAGFSANGNQGRITSQASMVDNGGRRAPTAYINGCLIAADPNEKGIFSDGRNAQTTDDVVVEFGTSISDAAVLLQSLSMRFDGDHHVRTLGAGVPSWTTRGSGVTLHGLQAFMKDDSGHNQVNPASGASVVVIAVP